MAERCGECGKPSTMRLWGVLICTTCGWRETFGPEPDESETVPEKLPALEDLYVSRLYANRVVQFKGHPFINVRALEANEDYYSHSVGDIIAVIGPGGSTIFFELAGVVAADDDSVHEEGYLLIRVDPRDVLGDWPMIDVDPGEMAMELLDGEAESQGSD